MLIAKVLDKLFNRRNTFEVESLEGDIGGISLQDCLEWVNSMKDKIVYDEADFIVFNNPIYTDQSILLVSLSQLQNEDADPFFPSLTNQAGKSVVVNAYGTRFEYVNAPRLWTTDDDFNDLSDELLEQLKVGDVIYSESEGRTVIVDAKDSGNGILKTFDTDYITIFNYVNEDDEWSCETIETPLGTKLYSHSLHIEGEDSNVDGYEFGMRIISPDNTQITTFSLTNSNAFVASCNEASMFGTSVIVTDIEISSGYVNITGLFGDGNFRSIDLVSSIEVTDTVTPL